MAYRRGGRRRREEGAAEAAGLIFLAGKEIVHACSPGVDGKSCWARHRSPGERDKGSTKGREWRRR